MDQSKKIVPIDRPGSWVSLVRDQAPECYRKLMTRFDDMSDPCVVDKNALQWLGDKPNQIIRCSRALAKPPAEAVWCNQGIMDFLWLKDDRVLVTNCQESQWEMPKPIVEQASSAVAFPWDGLKDGL